MLLAQGKHSKKRIFKWPAAIAKLVERLTNHLKFEGSNLVPLLQSKNCIKG
jgi:hypothetical protein